MNVSRYLAVGGLGLVLSLGTAARAEEPVQLKRTEKKELLRDEHADHASKPATSQAAAKKKPTTEAAISADAKTELDALAAAYKKLTSLQLAGTLAADILVGGESSKEQAAFTSSFVAPNKFRHEMKGDIVVGSTGEKLYAYRPARNDYKQTDAPKNRVDSSQFPDPVRDILQMQNVGLMCALVDDAGKLLADGMTGVSKAADVTLGGRSFTALDFKGDKLDHRVLIDPQTHLVRQVVLDMKRTLADAGRPDVERATLTFDYTTVTTDDAKALPADAFAWAAPEGAKDAGLVDAEEDEAVALVGKDAPDFSLKGLDGKPVTLKEQRGSVVVLDFWATWCGPCKVSLPGLNKLYKELKDKGMLAFAVDLEEPKEKVQPVAAQLIPDVPVLLDADSAVAKSYGVTGIPQTVVVGRDGKVKKVIIGSGNEAKIRAAVEAALKEKQ